MAKIEFKPGTMLNPVPAVMVSCGDETEQNIITIALDGDRQYGSAYDVYFSAKRTAFP